MALQQKRSIPGELFASEEQIAAAVDEAGKWVSERFAGRLPWLIGVLPEGCAFTVDLAKAIGKQGELPVRLGFITFSNYNSTIARGSNAHLLRVDKGMLPSVRGDDVIFVHGLIRSGVTAMALSAIIQHPEYRAATVSHVALIRQHEISPKTGQLQAGVSLDYTGMDAPPGVDLFGYGLPRKPSDNGHWHVEHGAIYSVQPTAPRNI